MIKGFFMASGLITLYILYGKNANSGKNSYRMIGYSLLNMIWLFTLLGSIFGGSEPVLQVGCIAAAVAYPAILTICGIRNRKKVAGLSQNAESKRLTKKTSIFCLIFSISMSFLMFVVHIILEEYLIVDDDLVYFVVDSLCLIVFPLLAIISIAKLISPILKTKMHCPKCEAKIPLHSVFCCKCGYKIKIYCSNCNQLLKTDALFCYKCGTKTDKLNKEE